MGPLRASTLCIFASSLTLILANFAWAQTRPSNTPRGSVCLVEALEKLQEPSVPGMTRSAELEIGANYVWPYLSTDDGTLAPFVAHYGDTWFKARFPGKTPDQVEWRRLSQKEQQEILDTLTAGQRFFDERKILGLKIVVPKGSPLADFLPYVEMADPSDAGRVVGFELHLRSSKPASEIALTTRRASRELGRDRQHLHVHIPFPLNRVALETAPIVEPIKILEFYRRTELFSQMLSVMDTNINLSENMERAVTHFAPLRNQTFQDCLHWLSHSAHTRVPAERKVFSKGYVGLRGEGFYDQPSLWGIEVRAIHKSLPDSTTAAILDGFEKTGSLPNFGHQNNTITSWMITQNIPEKLTTGTNSELTRIVETVRKSVLPPEAKDTVVIKSVFPNDQTELSRRGQATLSAVLIRNSKSSVRSRHKQSELQQELQIAEFQRKFPQARFLFHSWESDPLFFSDRASLQRIQEAKLSAFRKFLKEDPPQEIMREFLIDSGVYDRFAKSLGISTEILRNE